MNVAIYYFKPLYETRGGVGRVATWFARRLVAEGHRVWCFVPAGFKVPGVECMGVSCDQVQTIEFPTGSWRRQHKFLKNAIKAHDIEIVFNQCGIYKQSNLVMNCGAKVITTHHSATEHLLVGRIPVGRNSFKFRIFGLIQRFVPELAVKLYDYMTYREIGQVIRKTDVFTVLAESYRDWFAKRFPKYEDKFRVISNPIPFQHDNVSDFQKKVLFVGNIDPVKRLDRLIEVWSRLQSRFINWKLQIVGSGSQLEEMKAFAKAKGLMNVEFTGRADPRDYYSHASIICLTSDIEGVPMVLLEAMSYGIAPIVFDSFPAAREMVDDHVSGRVIPAFDIDAYMMGLADMMNGAADDMREAVLEAAKPYAGDYIFAKWQNLLAEVVR